MPKNGDKPIEFSDLSYAITKVCFDDDSEIEVNRRAGVILGEPGTFYMHAPGEVSRKLSDARITDIFYDVTHRPSGTVSPLYHHIFKGDAAMEGNGKRFIGPMRLHPAEQVWPELTRLGYYGELPQFYT